MAEKEISNIKTSTFTKKLVKDVHSNFNGSDTWKHARNTMVHGMDGQLFTLSNEQSNKLCYQFESTPLSQIQLRDNRLLIIQQNGEFGILNIVNCTYEKLFKVDCPEYKFTCKPIIGRSRILNNVEEYVVFGNEDIDIGEINLSNIPYKYTINKDTNCKEKIIGNEIDCKQLFQFKETTIPCLEIKKGRGNLPNGTYSVGISYLAGGDKIGDYQSLSTPIQIFNQNRGGIDLTIKNLDQNYEEYQILLIVNTAFNGQENSAVNNESYYTYGPYSTSQSKVTISDISNIRETLDRVIIENRIPSKVGNITSNSEYLLYSDIQYSEPLDYQLQAMNIEVEYVIKQVPLEYYKNNFDFGYFGDENYSPAIRWITNKGEKSNRYHIPGRKKTGKDSSNASGDEVFELDKNLNICDAPEKIQQWQVKNTAGNLIRKETLLCDGKIIGKGEMAYFESTELYPSDKLLFGDDACTPIRYPKFPDECIAERYTNVDGVIHINLKLWQFKKIEHPKNKDGAYRKDIVGYEILRQSREAGNKSVLATGYLSNIRSMLDQKREILYQNYPFNDQSPDSFHSSTIVNSKNNKEQGFNPLSKVYKDRFSFYTADANYGLKTGLGEELKILTEEKAEVKGSFEEVYRHPKATLITNFSLYLASFLGLIQAYLELNGKVCKTTQKKNPEVTTTVTTTPPATTTTTVVAKTTLFETCDTLWNKSTSNTEDLLALKPNRVLMGILQTTAKTLGFTLLASQHAQIWLDIIQKLVKPRSYAYQHNSVATFNQSKCINKRRYVKDYLYIPDNNVELNNGTIFNNFKGNKTIYVELNKEVPEITFEDNSNRTATEFGVCNDITNTTSGSAAMYYAISKISNRNQYGTLDSGQYVKTHSCPIVVSGSGFYESPVIAGGDCVIVQTSFQTRRQVFSQSISNYNNADDFIFNYKNYRNLGYPRFYYNNEPYELTNIVSKAPSQGKLPAQNHNLDCKKNNKNLFTVTDEYMYTSINGVVNHIVEADANLWFREETTHPHYSSENSNLSSIFRSDRLEFAEEFKLSPSFFKLETNQIFSQQQLKIDDLFRDKNAVIYSLPAFKNQRVNNWKSFLNNNYYSFDNLQFGNLIGVHSVDMDRLIFLFDKASPYLSVGRSELQLNNDTITIGDGGLFARQPREIMHTDVAYGSTQSKYAFLSTPSGYYYPSASQGRLFRFSEKSLDDVTKQGIHFWSKEFMPLKLKKVFPNYAEEDNIACGVGYSMVYDNFYETIYLCKKDYVPLLESIIYNSIKKQFEYQGNPISLNNPLYFKSASWTLSYRAQNEGFISFHDWHPDGVVQLEDHFLTIKNNALWKHNDNCGSYCNFYGKDYPWEVSPIISYGQEINILNSFEYQLEAYHYINNCLDKYHVLKENFDRAIVSNSEQNSGMLNLITKTEVRDIDLYNYPKVVNNFTTDVLCIKKENRYRFNGFNNIVKDRGEFSNMDAYILKNDDNGYTRSLYTINMDSSKISKFRHSYHEIWLAKEVSGRTQFIFKFLNSKITNSIR